MIQANQLRIGNYAFREGILVQVDGRSIMDAEAGLVSYEGVPLTRDWLVKFGFVPIMGSYAHESHLLLGVIHQEGDNSIKMHGTGSEFWYCFNDTMIMSKFKYVHQLMNLFHALTGQELTIK